MSANGFMGDSELAYIDNGQRLVPAAAKRYNALRAAAHQAGHPFSALEGYRSYATQQYLWSLYGSPRASYPGLSPHGYGLAVDITNDSDPQGIIRFKDPLYNWLAANAGAYGFNNRVGVSINEAWHWVYDGTGAAGHDATLFPTETETPQQQEEEMKPILLEIANADKSTQWALVSGDLRTFVPIWKAATAGSLSTLLIQGTQLKSAIVPVSKDEWNGFRVGAGLAPDPAVG